jgi:5-methylthioadenosine/S-adenosylhomocysteine deaminase
VAAILHKVTSPNYKLWPTAEEVLRAATVGGARSAMIHDQVGSLAVGKKADLVVFDTKSINFTPLNDLRNHLVYCENGTSITTVIVDGEIVVKDGALTRVDETALLEELRSYLPEFQKHHSQVEAINREFEPYFAQIHRRCCEQDVGINRYSSSQSEWRW